MIGIVFWVTQKVKCKTEILPGSLTAEPRLLILILQCPSHYSPLLPTRTCPLIYYIPPWTHWTLTPLFIKCLRPQCIIGVQWIVVIHVPVQRPIMVDSWGIGSVVLKQAMPRPPGQTPVYVICAHSWACALGAAKAGWDSPQQLPVLSSALFLPASKMPPSQTHIYHPEPPGRSLWGDSVMSRNAVKWSPLLNTDSSSPKEGLWWRVTFKIR